MNKRKKYLSIAIMIIGVLSTGLGTIILCFSLYKPWIAYIMQFGGLAISSGGIFLVMSIHPPKYLKIIIENISSTKH